MNPQKKNGGSKQNRSNEVSAETNTCTDDCARYELRGANCSATLKIPTGRAIEVSSVVGLRDELLGLVVWGRLEATYHLI